jgi:hypothetical protein
MDNQVFSFWKGRGEVRQGFFVFFPCS